MKNPHCTRRTRIHRLQVHLDSLGQRCHVTDSPTWALQMLDAVCLDSKQRKGYLRVSSRRARLAAKTFRARLEVQ